MSFFVVFELATMAAIQSHFVAPFSSKAFVLGSQCLLASRHVALDLVNLLTELLLSPGLFIELASHAVELGPGVRLGGLGSPGLLSSLRRFLKS